MEYFDDRLGFLEEIGSSGHWGYLIYRTVYTPESDEKWDAVVAKIDTYVKGDLYRAADPNEERKAVSNSILARYRNTILQDPDAFDHASPDTLREHFLQLLADNGKRLNDSGPDNRMFMMIDEETLNSILAAPEDPHEAPPSLDEWRSYRVELVDATWNPNPPPRVAGRGPPPRPPAPPGTRMYQGWLYVTFYKLWFLYHRVFIDPDLTG
jgi:hypothetical protein